MDKFKQCPKCYSLHGNDWSQCIGGCPINISPYYDEEVFKVFGGLSEKFEQELENDF
jgi:hypothetical protein